MILMDPYASYCFIMGQPYDPWIEGEWKPSFLLRPRRVEGKLMWLRRVERRRDWAKALTFTPFGAYHNSRDLFRNLKHK